MKQIVAETHRLAIDGTTQTPWLRSSQRGRPPLLIVQAGPGLPLLSEASRWQKLLRLEDSFAVAHWDQRGCGAAAPHDTQALTLDTQRSDLVFVLEWLFQRFGQPVLVLGVSIGATLALQVAASRPELVRAVVAVSPDLDVRAADQAIYQSLDPVTRARHPGPPPYLDPARFQRRGQLLADRGSLESGKIFLQLALRLVTGIAATYGFWRVPRVMANLRRVQSRLLGELEAVNLFESWPALTVPVHWVFGRDDLLSPAAAVEAVRTRLGPRDTFSWLARAGHLAAFDQPEIVRKLVLATL